MDDFVKLLRNNFVKYTVSLENYRTLHMDDQPKYNIVNLISQVGSILNLWSGITVMIVIEVIELWVRVFNNNTTIKVCAMEAEKNNITKVHALETKKPVK